MAGSCSHTLRFSSPKSWVHTGQPVFTDSQFPDRQNKRHCLMTPLYISRGFRLVVMLWVWMYPLLVVNDYPLFSPFPSFFFLPIPPLASLGFIVSPLPIFLDVLRLQSHPAPYPCFCLSIFQKYLTSVEELCVWPRRSACNIFYLIFSTIPPPWFCERNSNY